MRDEFEEFGSENFRLANFHEIKGATGFHPSELNCAFSDQDWHPEHSSRVLEKCSNTPIIEASSNLPRANQKVRIFDM